MNRFRALHLALPALAGLGATAALLAQPVVGPQIRVDVNGGTEAANETTIASVNSAPQDVVAAWNDWRRSSGSTEIINMGFAVSLDGRQTWSDFLVRPPAPNQSSVEGDPMTAYDERTGNLWVGAISFASNGGLYVARKEPGSPNFLPSVQVGQQSFADKCWMQAGPLPDDPDSTVVYIAYNEGVVRSTDLGDTWSSPVFAGFGIGFLPRIGPEGEVYVTYWDFGFGVRISRSFDGGQSFETNIPVATRLDTWSTQDGSRFPGNFRVPPLNALAVDQRTGKLHLIYFDTTDTVNGNRNVDLYYTTSTDQASSWTTPVIIPVDDSDIGDQFFPWLEIDDKGRLHLVIYDSRRTDQNDGVLDGFFDAAYLYSTDDGATWTEARLTPEPFNCANDGLNRSQQFLGDYNGLGFGGNTVYPCYVSGQNGDTDTFVHVIEWPEPELVGPIPGDAGTNNTITVDNGIPGARTYVGYAFAPGSSSVVGCPGVTVDLANPVLIGSAVADGAGSAEITAFVPPVASGQTVFLQAVILEDCTTSNVVEYTFP